MKTVFALALAIAAAGCSYLPNLSLPNLSLPNLKPHRMEIQQGNFISQEMVSQLKRGMTKDQVRFVLGTPLVADVFHADRWDYMFTRLKANSSDLEHRHISVYFEDDKLIRVDGDVVASDSAKGGRGTP